MGEITEWSQERRPVVYCIGPGFALGNGEPIGFPAALLAQSGTFTFIVEPDWSRASRGALNELSANLVLVDADGLPFQALLGWVAEARRLQPTLPLIMFVGRGGDKARYLLREGSSWYYTKHSREWHDLAGSLRRRLPPHQLARALPGRGHLPALPPHTNPYVVGRPLTGASANLFTGRDDLFAWLEQNLRNTQHPNTLLIYGKRRIGKTSSLFQIVEGERGEKLRHGSGRTLVTAYIDLQRLAGRPTGEWMVRLGRETARQLQARFPEPPEFQWGDHTGSPYDGFDCFLDQLEQALPLGFHVLLAMDEFEQIKADIDGGLLDTAVLPFLRSQFQHRSRISFLICGSHELMDKYWSPFSSLAAGWELGPLRQDQAEWLIRAPATGLLSYDEAAVAAIWSFTAGHPYLIQTICHRLVGWEGSSRRISRADVDDVVRALVAESGPVAAELLRETGDGDLNLRNPVEEMQRP